MNRLVALLPSRSGSGDGEDVLSVASASEAMGLHGQMGPARGAAQPPPAGGNRGCTVSVPLPVSGLPFVAGGFATINVCCLNLVLISTELIG